MIPALLPLLLLCSPPTGDLRATLDSGRVAILHPNGQWEYEDATATEVEDGPKAAKWAEDAVEVWDTQLLQKTSEYDQKAVWLFLHFKNTTNQKIVGIITKVAIKNPFGRTLLSATYENEVVVDVGERLRNGTAWVYQDNQFISGEPYDRLWQVASEGTAKVEVQVLKVVLADGAVLKARPKPARKK